MTLMLWLHSPNSLPPSHLLGCGGGGPTGRGGLPLLLPLPLPLPRLSMTRQR
jgi:hypothetical protein